MQLCEYIFPISLPLNVSKNGILGVLRVKMSKYCVLTPKKHYPAWIPVRLSWCIGCQNRFNGLSSRSMETFTYKEIKKAWVVTLDIWGEVTPLCDLDQMWHVGTYWRRNHVCSIWWLSVKRCEFGERGNFALSYWLEVSPLQHWSHYRVITRWTDISTPFLFVTRSSMLACRSCKSCSIRSSCSVLSSNHCSQQEQQTTHTYHKC